MTLMSYAIRSKYPYSAQIQENADQEKPLTVLIPFEKIFILFLLMNKSIWKE